MKIWIDGDSARDRFLAPSGLMVPSQTRLALTAITGDKLWKERIDFWESVYGQFHAIVLLLPPGGLTSRIRHVYNEQDILWRGFNRRYGCQGGRDGRVHHQGAFLAK
jgi:hypothetical protein